MLRALLIALALAVPGPGHAAAADAPRAEAPVATIPFKKPEREPASEWAQALAALVVIGALAWAGLVALKRSRFVPPALRGGRRIRLVETARLDARVTLYLVASEGRGLLLGRCGDTLVMIRDFEAPTPTGAPGEGAP